MKKYFSFTTAQRVGVVAWTIVILVMIIFLNINFQKDHPDPFDVSIADLSYVQLNAQQAELAVTYEDEKGWQNKPDLFEFDPNSISKEEWKSLGFSEKQADVILNYKQKNGPFRSKQDLKKIFVISDEKYTELEPYVLLDDMPVSVEPGKVIELNSATTADLESLPLIGEKYAQRIIKYRTSLGGFASVTQLHEVYGMTEETYQVLAENVKLNRDAILKININSATKDAIDKHPYIDWPMTAEILKRRDQEKISSLDFLVEKGLLTPEKKSQLEPYIEF